MGDFNARELLSKLRSEATKSNDLSSFDKSSERKESKETLKPSFTPQLVFNPAQRRENMEIRIALEREIQSLQEEVTRLKDENKKLRTEKLTAEQNMAYNKQKSDDIIAKLRNKIAQQKLGSSSYGDQHSRVKRSEALLPPPPPTSTLRAFQENGYGDASDAQNLQPQSSSSFAGLTFSELMRRSTPNTPEFTESLRRHGRKSESYTPTSDPQYNAAKHSKSQQPSRHQSTTESFLNHGMAFTQAFPPPTQPHHQANATPYPHAHPHTHLHPHGAQMPMQHGNDSRLHQGRDLTSAPDEFDADDDLPVVEIDLR